VRTLSNQHEPNKVHHHRVGVGSRQRWAACVHWLPHRTCCCCSPLVDFSCQIAACAPLRRALPRVACSLQRMQTIKSPSLHAMQVWHWRRDCDEQGIAGPRLWALHCTQKVGNCSQKVGTAAHSSALPFLLLSLTAPACWQVRSKRGGSTGPHH